MSTVLPGLVTRSFSRFWLATGLVLMLTAALAPGGTEPAAAASVATTRPFAATSPFNVTIKSLPVIDANSAAMVARAARTGLVHANLFEYGIPIFTATSSTPKVSVVCAMSGVWGTCPLEVTGRQIPTNARANLGSDGVLTVINTSAGTVDEYWQAQQSGSGWKTTWGAVNSTSGSGWGGSSTGSGASRIAGVVRVSEIQAGVIEHALVMQSDNVCKGNYRPPAIKTDGDSTRPDCIPEGARLQLDPSVNVAAINGITPGERTVARALQVYGAYVIDRANTSLAISFELAADGSWASPGAVYSAAGFGWDYYGMPHVPWSKLRVLKTWNG